MTLEELSAWLRASRPERDDLPQVRGEVHAGGMDIEITGDPRRRHLPREVLIEINEALYRGLSERGATLESVLPQPPLGGGTYMSGRQAVLMSTRG